MRTDQRESRVHLYHRKPAAGRSYGIALMRVRLLSDPQGIELGLKPDPIDRDGNLD